MSDVSSFVFRVLAGGLFAAAFGVLVDTIFGIYGWWLWGMCAGAIVGALLAYRRVLDNDVAAQKQPLTAPPTKPIRRRSR